MAAIVSINRDQTRSTPRYIVCATPPTVFSQPTAPSIWLRCIIDRFCGIEPNNLGTLEFCLGIVATIPSVIHCPLGHRIAQGATVLQEVNAHHRLRPYQRRPAFWPCLRVVRFGHSLQTYLRDHRILMDQKLLAPRDLLLHCFTKTRNGRLFRFRRDLHESMPKALQITFGVKSGRLFKRSMNELKMAKLKNNVNLAESDLRRHVRLKFDIFRQALPAEKELFVRWKKSNEILVTILCATYQHGELLEDAIKSLLLQKTDFRFEIVIRDDASTDGTPALIHHYTEKYPNVIRSLLYETNQHSLGRRPLNDFYKIAKGEYIAFCDGDDFWIDQCKLQDQINLLKGCPDCVVSTAGTHYLNVDSFLKAEVSSFDLEQPLKGEASGHADTYYHTSSLVIKRVAFEAVSKLMLKYEIYGDAQITRLLAYHGKSANLSKIVSVYWMNSKGSWTSLDDQTKLKEIYFNHVGMLRALKALDKVKLLPNFLRYSALYFPIAVSTRDWKSVVFCLVPYLAKLCVKLLSDMLRSTLHGKK